MPSRKKRQKRHEGLTPEEATRNIDPQEVRHVPAEMWTRKDFLRDLRRASRRHRDEEQAG